MIYAYICAGYIAAMLIITTLNVITTINVDNLMGRQIFAYILIHLGLAIVLAAAYLELI